MMSRLVAGVSTDADLDSVLTLLPTRSDINYVEPAESLYAERGAHYLSAKITCDAEGAAKMNRVTFILAKQMSPDRSV